MKILIFIFFLKAQLLFHSEPEPFIHLCVTPWVGTWYLWRRIRWFNLLCIYEKSVTCNTPIKWKRYVSIGNGNIAESILFCVCFWEELSLHYNYISPAGRRHFTSSFAWPFNSSNTSCTFRMEKKTGSSEWNQRGFKWEY